MRIFPLIGIVTVALSIPFPSRLSAQTASVQEDKPAQKTLKIEETQVTAEREQEPERGYAVKSATSATKTDTPLLETPQAVSVVSRALIDDQGARKLDDVLKNVAGVVPGGYYSDWDYYRIRGFDASFTTYWDGLRGDYGKNAELFGLERVEVVKGPASSLYGQGPLGGLVNLVSKRPRPEMFADTSFTVGSYNFYEPAMGLGAPLNKSKTVYARLNALYRHQESFVHFVDKERAFLAPALTWEIGPDTVLTVLTQYVHDWDKLGFPLPAKGMVLPNINGDIPINRFVGERNDSNEVEQWRARVGYQFTHQFNQTFSLRQNLSVSRLWQKKCFTAGARLGPDCCLHLQRREDYQRQHPARRRSPARRARVRLQCMDEIHAAE